MEEQKSIFARVFDWVRGQFTMQEADTYEPAVIGRMIETDQESDSYLEAKVMNLLDPVGQEYVVEDNVEDAPQIDIFDSSVKNLAVDIEDYLSTYCSPPFGYTDIVGQRNSEEWIETIKKSLIHENDFRNLISDSLTKYENMNNHEVKNIAESLLFKIDFERELNEPLDEFDMVNIKTALCTYGIELQEDSKFQSLVCMKVYHENTIINLKEDIAAPFLCGSSPDEIAEYQKGDEEDYENHKETYREQLKYSQFVVDTCNLRIEEMQDNINSVFLTEKIEIAPQILSYPLSSLSGEGCPYAKAAMDVRLFQSVFGAVNMKYYDTHDVYVQNQNGELSGFLMDKVSKDIICDYSLANISKESLTACVEAMNYMKIYANCDMTSVVPVGESLDSAKNEYSVKQGLSDYFKKSNQNLVMSVRMQSSDETQYFVALNEEKQLDVPSVQDVIPTLYEEHDVRGVLAGIADLSGVKVNDPYNILGRDVYMSPNEIRNQIISKAYISFPSDRLINSMDSLNRAVGFNCSMEDVKKLAKGEVPEGSCLKNVPHKAKELADNIDNDLHTTERIMGNESMLDHDWCMQSDYDNSMNTMGWE